MGDQHGRFLLPPQHLVQQPTHGRRGIDVERGQRLVEQQQSGIGGQRPRQRDALGLTAGELTRLARRQPICVHFGQPALGELAGLGLADADRAGAEGDVFQRGQVREQ